VKSQRAAPFCGSNQFADAVEVGGGDG